MAYLQKPSIDDLKRICTSLEGCVGFSSSGWIKSAISQKRPLTGSDLYVKVVHRRAGTNVLQSEVITAYLMHSAHYQEMLDHLKMYLFPYIKCDILYSFVLCVPRLLFTEDVSLIIHKICSCY